MENRFVTIDGQDVVLETIHKTTRLINARDDYRRWAVRAYGQWDGNDLMDLLNYMAEPDNVTRFAKFWPEDKTVEINHELN
jgi:hypothetical protein